MMIACGSSPDSNPPFSKGDEDRLLVRTTRYGEVQGILGDANTYAWLGIPFANPPVGELRWKAPREPEPWEGSRPADTFAGLCPQIGGLTGILDPDTFGLPIGNEDCLYLNIWRPRSRDLSDKEILPVYFWIHGGGNSVGYAAMSLYDGANFSSRTNMVFVSINYRLGPLGWLTHPMLREGDVLDDSGNYGTLDIIKALEWVRDNISAFGGDPGNVTIAGESAGGMNVYSMLASPLADGLFHRAVSQSGAPISTPMSVGEAHSQRLFVQLLLRDGLATNEEEAEDLIQEKGERWARDYLRSKTPGELLACQTPMPSGMLIDTLLNMIFQDGTVLTESPLNCFRKGDYNKVPFLVGNNAEELKLFLPLFVGRLTEKELGRLVMDLDPGVGSDLKLEDLLHPLFWPVYEPLGSLGGSLFQAVGVDTPASQMSMHQDDVYAYRFAWDEEPPPMDFLIGAGHAMEIPFIFGNFQLDENSVMRFSWSEENRPGREELSHAMMTYWANFARTGDPNTPDTGLPLWHAWSDEPGAPKRMLLDTGP
jgi:para-nitrobenzyl esterase